MVNQIQLLQDHLGCQADDCIWYSDYSILCGDKYHSSSLDLIINFIKMDSPNSARLVSSDGLSTNMSYPSLLSAFDVGLIILANMLGLGFLTLPSESS